MKTFVATLVTAGAAISAGPALAQYADPAAFDAYRDSGRSPAYHARDQTCADGSCPTSNFAPGYGRDNCPDGNCSHGTHGFENQPGRPHQPVAGMARPFRGDMPHQHAADCQDGSCGHLAPRPQAGHICSGDNCDHPAAGGVMARNRPDYRIGRSDPRQRPASAYSPWPATARPETRFSADQSFPPGEPASAGSYSDGPFFDRSYRPATNDAFETDAPFGPPRRSESSPWPARGMRPQQPSDLGRAPFDNGNANESRPW